MKLTS
jgi:hypothetical protein